MSELNNNSIKVKASCSLMELNIGLPRKNTSLIFFFTEEEYFFYKLCVIGRLKTTRKND